MKTVDPLAGVTTFLTLAEVRSFAATAKRLGFSSATVSTQISDLERRLAVRLIHRSTRHVSLTEAGEAYRSALTGVLEQVQRGQSIAAALRTEVSGTLRIAASLGITRIFLKQTIDAFLEANPTLSIELDCTARPVDLVEGAFDIAIRGMHKVEPRWIARKLAVCSVHVAASPGYIHRRGVPQTPSELTQHDCIHYSGLSFGRVWFLQKEAVTERVAISPRLQCNDGTTLRQWALEGHGIALLPTMVIGDDLREGRLVPLLPGWTAPSFEVYAVYPENKHIAAKVKLFVNTLASNLRESPIFGSTGEDPNSELL